MTSAAKPKKTTAAADPPAQLPVVVDDDIKIAPADLCAGAQAPGSEDPLAPHEIAIKTGWNHATQGILQTCRACAEAQAIFDADSLHDLIERLPFDRTVFSKLVAIGNSPALNDPKLEKHLPPNWTILDLARKLTPTELGRAVSRNVISPDCNRAGLKSWMSNPDNCGYGAGLRLKRSKAAAVKSSATGATSQDPELESLVAAFFSSPVADKFRRASEPVRHRFWLRISAS
jgi:hypothetical protein